jgi:transposase
VASTRSALGRTRRTGRSDSHKRTHTFVAVDGNGREVAHKTVPATPTGHLEARRWAERWPERTWALEDCPHLSRRLEADLVRAGERVVRVPPKLMAAARRGGQERERSDPIDALALARAALRAPHLPAARLEGVERELRLLVDHREDVVGERTRAQNRLLWHLHELEPGWSLPAGSLSTPKTLDMVLERIEHHRGVVVAIARELVEDTRANTVSINALEREIAKLVAPLAPALLALAGCGALTAAELVGARIAITQMQRPGLARDHLDKRMAGGDTRTEAMRALRRKISDEVYRRVLSDERARTAVSSIAEAA